MQRTIILVFTLNIFGVRSGCYHDYGPGWGRTYSTNLHNYQCIQQERCLDSQFRLTPIQRRVTHSGGCDIVGQVCCRFRYPPPSTFADFYTRTPTRKPSSRISSQKPNRNRIPHADHWSSSLRPQPQSSTPISPQNANCNCIPLNRCSNEYKIPYTQVKCSHNHEICCRNMFQSSSTSTIIQSPQTKSPKPSQASPQIPTGVSYFQPTIKGQSQSPFSNTSPQIPTGVSSLQTTILGQSQSPFSKPSPQIPTGVSFSQPTILGQSQSSFSNTSPQIPAGVSSLQPTIQGPSQSPFSNTSPQQPLPRTPPEIFPLNIDCTCTPFFRCFDEETSSNLTGAVDDRTLTQQQRSCPSPNDICCRNLVPPSPTPIGNPSPQPQAQPQDLSAITPSTNANCNCIPTSECHDKDISSNPAGLIDGQNNNIPLRQESCANSNHVCCHHLVKPLSTPTRKPSTQPLPPNPSQISTQRPTVVQSPLPLSPSPAQSTSPSTNCLCTPFYKCYDEETSSNLTGVVDDRSFIPVAAQRTCSDPNEICCYNLVKPVIKPHTISSSEDCSGSCVPIQECPNLSNILNEASNGKSDAIQELRSLVCSVTGGRALVCCHQKGPKTRNNPFGVIFQNN